MLSYEGVILEKDTNTGYEDKTEPYLINCSGHIQFKTRNVSISRERVDYYLIYLVNGFGYYRFDKGFCTVPAGNIVIYKSLEVQDYYYIGNEKTELYWIHFTGEAAGKLLYNLGLAEKHYFKVGINTECIQLFEKIINEINIKNPGYHSFCIGYLLQLLSIFSREALLEEKGRRILKNADMEAVIRKMHTEYQQDHPVEYYANCCNLSVYQFIRKFKGSMQLSPSRYIEKIRMDKSRELLLDTDLTVSEISEIVGFNDPFYFSKVFKKNTGMNPKAFRRMKGLFFMKTGL